MNTPDQFRKALATILSESLKHNEATPSQLGEQLDLPFASIYDALQYGIIDAADLVSLCRLLGLCPEAVVETACNRTLEDLQADFTNA